MGDKTEIGWTDATWNPIRGCRRTAPAGSKQSGCGDPSGGGCYAERQAARFCGPGQPYEGLITLTAKGPRWSGKVRYVREHLMDPLRWRKPRRIFTDSMSDLFYDGVGGADEWVAANVGDLGKYIEDHAHEIAAVLESCFYGTMRECEALDIALHGLEPAARLDARSRYNDHKRTSINNIGEVARALARRLLDKAARDGR